MNIVPFLVLSIIGCAVALFLGAVSDVYIMQPLGLKVPINWFILGGAYFSYISYIRHIKQD